MDSRAYNVAMDPNKPPVKLIGIAGLGLIGGSLGLDLQSLGYEVIGLTNKPESVKRAKELGLASEVS